MWKRGSRKRKYSSVSLPISLLEQIDSLIKELGFWPSRSAFVREACLEKIRREREALERRREAERNPTRGTSWGLAPVKAQGYPIPEAMIGPQLKGKKVM